MQVAVFSAKSYDRQTLDAANVGRREPHQLRYFDVALDGASLELAHGCQAVCVFVNDMLDGDVLQQLYNLGVRLIALRCAGFNNVDVLAAQQLGLKVARVPAYSPHAVAEHTVGLMLSLNRRTHRAFQRVREGDFRLEGLLGFDMYGKTAGVIGAGAIGQCVVDILRGLGCEVLYYDIEEKPRCKEAGARYVSLGDVLRDSHIVTLHCPLIEATRHLIDRAALSGMRDGVMLINTSRGALVDTQAVIAALKSGKIGALGLDVYEEEAGLFFADHSDELLQDDVFARLLTFPNVLVTGHQAFFTREALHNIADTTLESVDRFVNGESLGEAEVLLA